MHVKIKSTKFERNGDCESIEEVEDCYRDCYDLTGLENGGCIGGIITNELVNDTECPEEDKLLKWVTDESVK